jgi:uncharacterized protein YdeI (YjbR/CyaY-like superfamily)
MRDGSRYASFFESPSEFRAWLEEHHADETELWVGFHKKVSGRAGITWSEAVDQAICFGWIDGIRKGIDEGSYANRFTPRKPRSTWSRVNIERVARLSEQGLMRSAGVAAFERRREERSGVYSFEQQTPELDRASKRVFRSNRRAWEFFQSQAPSYRRAVTWWVTGAKRQATRDTRLAALIEASERGSRLPQFSRPG